MRLIVRDTSGRPSARFGDFSEFMVDNHLWFVARTAHPSDCEAPRSILSHDGLLAFPKKVGPTLFSMSFHCFGQGDWGWYAIDIRARGAVPIPLDPRRSSADLLSRMGSRQELSRRNRHSHQYIVLAGPESGPPSVRAVRKRVKFRYEKLAVSPNIKKCSCTIMFLFRIHPHTI